MFLPFLPYIFALAGASLLLIQPEALPVAGDVPLFARVALGLLLPPLLGWLVGLLPDAWIGPRMALRPTRRRWITLFLWLAASAMTPLVPQLTQTFAPVLARWAAALGWPALAQATDEAVLAVLLADFWLADTLSLAPPRFRDVETVRLPGSIQPILVKEPGFFRILMLPVPFLALVVLGVLVSAGIEGGIEGLLADLMSPGLGSALDSMGRLAAIAVGIGFTLVSLVLLMPVLIRWCWGLRPLLSREADQSIQDELKANGVSVARVLAWPERMTGVVTAGVIGVLPGFRYLLFGNLLAAALTPQEIRSITAHEAAHLRFRHPLYYVLAVVACILLVQSVSEGIQLAGLVLGNPVPAWIVMFGELAALIILLRFGFGALSRHFEREADGHAYSRQGLEAFQTALSKVGKLNGIPIEIDNWHHFGISRRIGYLAQVQAHPERLSEHARTVHRQKLLWVLLFVAGLGLQTVVSASPIVAEAAQGYWERRIAEADSGTRPLLSADLPGLHALAMLAYERQDLQRAERYYRVILRVSPDDAQTENNLAWLLVTRSKADPATVKEGLSLAKRAAQGQDMAFIWDTLAEAYGRSGDKALAHAAAEKALQLAEKGRGLGEVRLEYYRRRMREFPGDGTHPTLPEELPKPSPSQPPVEQWRAPQAAPPAGVRMV